jgi:hypothetical protein
VRSEEYISERHQIKADERNINTTSCCSGCVSASYVSRLCQAQDCNNRLAQSIHLTRSTDVVSEPNNRSFVFYIHKQARRANVSPPVNRSLVFHTVGCAKAWANKRRTTYTDTNHEHKRN